MGNYINIFQIYSSRQLALVGVLDMDSGYQANVAGSRHALF